MCLLTLQEPGFEAATASPMSPTQGLVTSGPPPARAQPPAPTQSFTSRPAAAQSPAQPPAQPTASRQQPAIALPGSARDQVSHCTHSSAAAPAGDGFLLLAVLLHGGVVHAACTPAQK